MFVFTAADYWKMDDGMYIAAFCGAPCVAYGGMWHMIWGECRNVLRSVCCMLYAACSRLWAHILPLLSSRRSFATPNPVLLSLVRRLFDAHSVLRTLFAWHHTYTSH